ncbi:pyridoxal phosphate-dependent transferase [Talaromyces proteolyticus]|uniref:Pyridoxal phosphate-dependent transferase n=1 Tax=Talaromyces proteolyticus TaxID=1131652 RepID=A0AAD4Q6C9_9EURO|nr:pyridoxal phosphate-dependent transferase [Talaromyces proteolyticus]KAH8705222.1 pyridoxal phosphate-dependent transferase [Talaromyces proteolyticus]
MEFVEQGFQQIASHYFNEAKDIELQPICKVADPDTAKFLSEQYALPDDGPHEIGDVLKEAIEINSYRIRNDHPRFFGFIPSPVLPVAWLGDVISSVFNVHGGSRLQSSGASAIEKSLIHWMAMMAGFPAETAGGISVSGGSMANLTAIILARDYKLPHDKVQTGVAYVSDQTHSSVAKGLRILGFREHQVHMVRSDINFRLDTVALEDAIKTDRNNGLYPFLIIATCGTTNTGSIDPIEEITTIAQREQLWVHVDGAYGASVMLSKTHRSLFRGLNKADSISWDAHKWLFQTYTCSFVLVRDKALLYKSFHTGAEYVQDATEMDYVPNYWNFGMELTRPTRATKLWFTLRVLGLDQVSNMLDHAIKLAECAEREVRRLPHWQITSPANLAIVTFRFVPDGKSESELDELNTRISQQLLTENVAAALTSKVNNTVVLRICSIHPELSENSMKGVVARMAELAEGMIHAACII